jgi:hypothetical protein
MVTLKTNIRRRDASDDTRIAFPCSRTPSFALIGAPERVAFRCAVPRPILEQIAE